MIHNLVYAACKTKNGSQLELCYRLTDAKKYIDFAEL